MQGGSPGTADLMVVRNQAAALMAVQRTVTVRMVNLLGGMASHSMSFWRNFSALNYVFHCQFQLNYQNYDYRVNLSMVKQTTVCNALRIPVTSIPLSCTVVARIHQAQRVVVVPINLVLHQIFGYLHVVPPPAVAPAANNVS